MKLYWPYSKKNYRINRKEWVGLQSSEKEENKQEDQESTEKEWEPERIQRGQNEVRALAQDRVGW